MAEQLEETEPETTELPEDSKPAPMIYRVTNRTESGRAVVVVYCGTDRQRARRAYHTLTPDGVGQARAETIVDAGTGDFTDDVITQMRIRAPRIRIPSD